MANGNGIASVVDPASGERLWQERIGGVFTATPVAGDGKVFLFSETGEAVVLAAGRTPSVISRNPMDERVIASPAIAGGRIFVRSDRHLIAIGS
jgi:outer membrane protein assembly factor BamB